MLTFSHFSNLIIYGTNKKNIESSYLLDICTFKNIFSYCISLFLYYYFQNLYLLPLLNWENGLFFCWFINLLLPGNHYPRFS